MRRLARLPSILKNIQNTKKHRLQHNKISILAKPITMETLLKITGPVFYSFSDPPQVTLSLGSTLRPDDIKEGDDVYFECHIKSNPKEHRIMWSHDVSLKRKLITQI